MASQHITHREISGFADQRVNLPRERAQEYRDQVNRLRERLETHIAANPGFALVKMLHAGSVAKGTGLRTLNDLDVAVYVEKEKAPIRNDELVPWLAQRLREAYPMMRPDQFDESSPHCVTVKFRGSGLDVDVVPVLYEGAARDLGYLIDKGTGDRLLTSIPLHLEFIRARKKAHPDHFAQVVRLVKWWAAQRKAADPDFKCKSFLLELLIAHLADRGVALDDYPDALERIFSYIVKSGLEERIAFSDYYPASKLPKLTGAPIEIFDPVNPENNIAAKYSVTDRDALVRAAEEAGDAISEARYATTKERAVDCWQLVFGPSFRG
jgi:tRNA nucleotidyltransferase (CCA-adding enzyme)